MRPEAVVARRTVRSPALRRAQVGEAMRIDDVGEFDKPHRGVRFISDERLVQELRPPRHDRGARQRRIAAARSMSSIHPYDGRCASLAERCPRGCPGIPARRALGLHIRAPRAAGAAHWLGAASAIDVVKVTADGVLGLQWIVFGSCRRDAFNGHPQIRHVLAGGADNSDGERPDRLRELLPHLLQSPVRLCGDQDALPLREQVDEHRGRVSLSGTRRALDESLGVRIDLTQDPQLHVVDGERENGSSSTRTRAPSLRSPAASAPASGTWSGLTSGRTPAGTIPLALICSTMRRKISTRPCWDRFRRSRAGANVDRALGGGRRRSSSRYSASGERTWIRRRASSPIRSRSSGCASVARARSRTALTCWGLPTRRGSRLKLHSRAVDALVDEHRQAAAVVLEEDLDWCGEHVAADLRVFVGTPRSSPVPSTSSSSSGCPFAVT